jgi:hypothetical protein
MHKAEYQILLHDRGPYDPRTYAATIFKSKKGGADKLASAATTAELDGKKLTFTVPSHAALCLNLSNAAFRRAQKVTVDSIFHNATYGLTAEKNIGVLFNLFEQLILNIVFAYTALEAFSNQMVPDDFVFRHIRQDKKCEESYTKEQIERHISLDTKFAEVLPTITGQQFEKGTALWNEYVGLRKIRDRIIHVKSDDLGVRDMTGKSIWADLLERRSVDSSLIAHGVIKHFPQNRDISESPVAGGRNRWIDHFPFIR